MFELSVIILGCSMIYLTILFLIGYYAIETISSEFTNEKVVVFLSSVWLALICGGMFLMPQIIDWVIC